MAVSHCEKSKCDDKESWELHTRESWLPEENLSEVSAWEVPLSFAWSARSVVRTLESWGCRRGGRGGRWGWWGPPSLTLSLMFLASQLTPGESMLTVLALRRREVLGDKTGRDKLSSPRSVRAWERRASQWAQLRWAGRSQAVEQAVLTSTSQHLNRRENSCKAMLGWLGLLGISSIVIPLTWGQGGSGYQQVINLELFNCSIFYSLKYWLELFICVEMLSHWQQVWEEVIWEITTENPGLSTARGPVTC